MDLKDFEAAFEDVIASADEIEIGKLGKTVDYVAPIPRRIVAGYLLFQIQKIRKGKGLKPYDVKKIPAYIVKLAGALDQLSAS